MNSKITPIKTITFYNHQITNYQLFVPLKIRSDRNLNERLKEYNTATSLIVFLKCCVRVGVGLSRVEIGTWSQNNLAGAHRNSAVGYIYSVMQFCRWGPVSTLAELKSDPEWKNNLACAHYQNKMSVRSYVAGIMHYSID